MKELDSKIASFIQNYLIVDRESLLLDTAQKLETIIKQTSTVSDSVLSSLVPMPTVYVAAGFLSMG